MDRKEFIIKMDSLTDRELRQLFNFIYQYFEENEDKELLKEQMESIKSQRNI